MVLLVCSLVVFHTALDIQHIRRINFTVSLELSDVCIAKYSDIMLREIYHYLRVTKINAFFVSPHQSRKHHKNYNKYKMKSNLQIG
jgi:hypothetical protein